MAETLSSNYCKNRFSKSLASCLLAVSGISLANSEPAKAGPLIEHSQNTQYTSEQNIINPETLVISSDIAEIMRKNTVYLPELGCSGYLIRNSQDTPVGFLTAEHCGLENKTTNGVLGLKFTDRILNTDGSYSFGNNIKPIKVELGDVSTKTKTIGTASSFILTSPETSDPNIDIALGILDTSSAEEVLNAYNSSRITNEELENISLGETIYMSGWPGYKLDNPFIKIKKRQDFALTSISKVTMQTSPNFNTRMLVSAIATNKDGTNCSPGSSGSAVFAIINGQPKIIGTLSIIIDLTGHITGQTKQEALITRNDFSNNLGVDLSNPKISALCGISYEFPTNLANAQIVKVKTN